jgi:hypothetical protein
VRELFAFLYGLDLTDNIAFQFFTAGFSLNARGNKFFKRFLDIEMVEAGLAALDIHDEQFSVFFRQFPVEHEKHLFKKGSTVMIG